MNTLERATQPRDTSGWVVVPSPAPGPNPSMPVAPVSPFVRSSLPGTVSGLPDALRGFYSGTQRQQRFWQPGSQVATQAVSSSASQARAAALQVMSGLNLNAIKDTPAYSKLPSNLLSNGQLVLPKEASYRGDWDGETNYIEGDEVTDQGYLWEAAADNFNSEPSRTNVHWNLLGPSSLASYKGAWSSTGTYNPGEETADAGYIWQCTSPVGPSSTHPASDTAHWVQVGPANLQNFQGAWTAGTYQAGAEVSFNAYIWQANTTTTSQPGADGTWSQIGPSNINNYQGTYNGGAYLAGQQVSYSGNVYLATQNVPAGIAPTNPSYWVLVGPNNLDSVADGGSFAKINKAAVGPSGAPDFGSTFWVNKTLGNLPDGDGWQKVTGVSGNQTTTGSYQNNSITDFYFSTNSPGTTIATGATVTIGPANTVVSTGGSNYSYIVQYSGSFEAQPAGSQQQLYVTINVVIDVTVIASYTYAPGFGTTGSAITIPLTRWYGSPGHQVSVTCYNQGTPCSTWGYMTVLALKG